LKHPRFKSGDGPYSGFPLFFLRSAISESLPQIRPWPFPSTSFLIHYSLAILPCLVSYSESLRAPLNKPVYWGQNLTSSHLPPKIPKIKIQQLLKECHPRCVYQIYSRLIINNDSQKHNYICKYNK